MDSKVTAQGPDLEETSCSFDRTDLLSDDGQHHSKDQPQNNEKNSGQSATGSTQALHQRCVHARNGLLSSCWQGQVSAPLIVNIEAAKLTWASPLRTLAPPFVSDLTPEQLDEISAKTCRRSAFARALSTRLQRWRKRKNCLGINMGPVSAKTMNMYSRIYILELGSAMILLCYVAQLSLATDAPT